MKLAVFPRKSERKSDPKKNRRQGEVPGIIYGLNQANRTIFVKEAEIQTILRNIRQGLLPTTIFTLHEGSQEHKALVKDIQYHPTSYAVLHVDFLLLSDQEPLTVNVPIQIAGVAECVGIKLGGFLRQVIRFLKVRCLPKDIPQEFVINVQELNITESKSLKDISIPEQVRPLAKLSEVAVVIGKRA